MSRRHITHQGATRKKPKEKCPIQKGGKYYQIEGKGGKRRSSNKGEKRGHQYGIAMGERRLLFLFSRFQHAL